LGVEVAKEYALVSMVWNDEKKNYSLKVISFPSWLHLVTNVMLTFYLSTLLWDQNFWIMKETKMVQKNSIWQ
jgi:hypothetical protein